MMSLKVGQRLAFLSAASQASALSGVTIACRSSACTVLGTVSNGAAEGAAMVPFGAGAVGARHASVEWVAYSGSVRADEATDIVFLEERWGTKSVDPLGTVLETVVGVTAYKTSVG